MAHKTSLLLWLIDFLKLPVNQMENKKVSNKCLKKLKNEEINNNK